MRRVRIVLGVLLLLLSIVLLLWGFWPSEREIRTQPISPTELQLPSPSSFRIYADPVSWQPCESVGEL